MKVTAAMVKELREKTGAGMLDCKKALEATEGNIEKAITYLRERGIAQAVKKQSRIAAEGLTSVVIKDNVAVLYELNSETDFVSKNDKFINLLNKVGELIINSGVDSVEDALLIKNEDNETINDMLVSATATIGEKITLRRLIKVTKTDEEGFGFYKHMGGRISVLTVTDKENPEVAKDIAMHVCVFNPRFVSKNDVDQATIDNERDIIVNQIEKDSELSSKPDKIKNGIIMGRLNKTLQDFVLLDQGYVKDGDIKVSKYLKDNNTNVVSFYRLEVGEGIEKVEENFAEEVMAQIKNK